MFKKDQNKTVRQCKNALKRLKEWKKRKIGMRNNLNDKNLTMKIWKGKYTNDYKKLKLEFININKKKIF